MMKVLLNEIASVQQGGKMGLSGKHFVLEGYPAYGAGGINGFLPDYEFEGAGVILSANGARCGKCFYAEGRWASLANTQVILPDVDKVVPKFLWYQLNDEKRWRRAGTAQPFIKPSDVKNKKIILPDLKEQRGIVGVLDTADGLRQKRKKSFQLLDDFLRAKFIDMFGDSLLNPKGFQIIILEKAFTKLKAGTKCGPFGSALKKHEYVEQGVPVWTMENIGDNSFISDGCLFITEEKYSALEGYSVEPGDIIISRAGTVGKMCVVNKQVKRSIISTNLIRLSLDKNIIEPQYFTFLMTQFPGRVGRLKTGADGAYTFMNTGILSELELPRPPIELQRQFLNIRDVVKNIQIKEAQQLSDMDNQFNALMQKYFSEADHA